MAEQTNVIDVDLGSPNSEKQWDYFCEHKARYINYGGARGGGKTWASTHKAVKLALRYDGISILFIRREYDDLRSTIITPILKMVPEELYTYNKTEHLLTFENGSVIQFGNMPGYGEAVGGKYQGREYDILFLEEATQFTEDEFRGLDAIVRGVNDFPKRVYMTCNPGGIGHFWVKRLFVDRKFKDDEDPADYKFIQATVDDNVDLVRTNPRYIKVLDNLPEDIRNAHRYGDWEVLSGVFFSEFTPGIHTCKPFPIPKEWKRYRAMDYGLDMHFCIWAAVDPSGRSYIYRQYYKPDQTPKMAAAQQLELTRPDEEIGYTIAPPDVWSRSKDTGKSPAEMFAMEGVPLVKADNDRVNGWTVLKEMFALREDGKPSLIIFDTCGKLIDCITCLMHDKTNPNDVAKNPHDITHGPDALRYFAKSHVIVPEILKKKEEEEELDQREDYMVSLFGNGHADASYMF